MARKPTVETISERYSGEHPHIRHVTRLALHIFDKTHRALDLSASSRAVLETAARLHDVGYSIDPSGHGAASASILLCEGVRGLSADAAKSAAQIILLHQDNNARPKSPTVAAASKRTLKLAAILRVADGLDHSHAQNTHIQTVSCTKKGVHIAVHSQGYLGNVESAARKADLWNRVFTGYPLSVAIVKKKKRGGSRFEGIVTQSDCVLNAARKLLLVQHRNISDNYEGMLKGANCEALHDLRTSLRRFREAMRLFSSHMQSCSPDMLADEVKRIGGLLGETRDLDVWLEFIESEDMPKKVTRSAQWSRFVKNQKRTRDRKADALRLTLKRSGYAALMRRTAYCLRVHVPLSMREHSAQPLKPLAAATMLKALKRIRAKSAYARDRNPAEIHSLRKTCRRARYAAEFFAPALGASTAQLSRRLHALTDALGEMHDRDVDIARLKSMRGSIPTGLKGYIIKKRRNAKKRFRGEWKKFISSSYQNTLTRNLEKAGKK